MNEARIDTASPGRGRTGRCVAWLVGLYLVVVLAVWGLLCTESDEWWPATVVMFLPRWIWGVPLVVLAVAAAWFRPGLLWIILIGGVVVAWPFAGLCIPWPTSSPDQPAVFRCRVLTCNVHRNPFAIKTVIAATRPDIVALQDCPDGSERRVFDDEGWHVCSYYQFLLGSRYPIREQINLESPGVPSDVAVRTRLETPAGSVRFFNIHLSTPRQALVELRLHGWNGVGALEENSANRRIQSAVIVAWMGEEDGPLLAAGDFNTPPDSTIYSAYWSHYANAFSEAGLGWGHTYRMNRTTLRLDHILSGPGWRCRGCWVGPDLGSEHRAVIADLEWYGTPP
jgi:endonuclease/exonuclease/phosphatase family metal-dependent hydrolase